jgi:uncharacterized protein YoxC
MLPTWVGVVIAISLAIIALAVLATGIAITITAMRIQSWLRTLSAFAAPALEDARHLIGTIRSEVDALADTSRDLRHRIVRAADAAEMRLAQVNALLGGVQGSVESTARGVAATIRLVLPTVRTLLRNIKLPPWGQRSGHKKIASKKR